MTKPSVAQSLALDSLTGLGTQRARQLGELHRTEERLRHESRTAYAYGVPLARLARAAGVSRLTMRGWLKPDRD